MFKILNLKHLVVGYFIVVLGLFFYSFTQIDLSLTLSRASFVQTIEKWFQQIGYFQRQLSTELYIMILLLLSVFYIVFLVKAAKGKLDPKMVWKLIIGIAVVLLLSYNAFSYDLFNYIFDAKIVTHYHLNPYIYKALDFPHDPMLSFMHSTHRTYPYGPIWLLLTIPLSFLGLGLFIPTLILFKLIAALAYLGVCHFISKILQKEKKNISVGLVLFALNPLIIIESLVSAHNDVVMAFFAVLAVYLIISNKRIMGSFGLIISAATKLTTIFLAQAFLFYFLNKNKGKLFTFSAVCMILATIVVSAASGQNKNPEIQPWYFISFLPFISLIKNRIAWILSIFSSIGIMLSYIPFLFNGQWPTDIVVLKNELVVGSLVLGLIVSFLPQLLRSQK